MNVAFSSVLAKNLLLTAFESILKCNAECSWAVVLSPWFHSEWYNGLFLFLYIYEALCLCSVLWFVLQNGPSLWGTTPLGGRRTRWTGSITGRTCRWSTSRIWRGTCSPNWRAWSSFWAWRFPRTACSASRARRTGTSNDRGCGSSSTIPTLPKCERTLTNWSEQ